MAIVSGLLAMALVAADGPSGAPVETTTYQVRVLTLDGLDWRTTSYTRLQPVAHQGTSAIWTADRSLAKALADRSKASFPCHTIMAVGEAVLTKAEAVNYVASMDRVADGPVNQSSAIAFMPRPQQVEERFAIKVSGRKLDQGVLTRIALEETHVDVIHGVPQTETLVATPGKDTKGTAEVDCDIHNVSLAPAPAGLIKPKVTTITSSVQIPEISRAKVEGEWLIPNDGVLLVSLGVKTAADAKGMAVVRERVAVIEAIAGPTDPEGRQSKLTAAIAAPFEHTKLAQPVVPGRGLPEAIDPSGNLIELPPLPEALASADLDRIKPEPYQPSPQNSIRSAPSADPALARTSYDAVPAAPRSPIEAEADACVMYRKVFLNAFWEAMAKVDLDLDFDIAGGPKTKATCEKCDADAALCPADPKSSKPGEVAGGIKLVPDGPTGIAVSMKLTGPGIVFWDESINMSDALKTPGKTDTTLVDLGNNLSLELKATVVPTSPEKAKAAAKKVESPAATRR